MSHLFVTILEHGCEDNKVTVVLDERFFPLIFDAIPVGIFTIDSNQTITSFNRMASELTGFSCGEAVGKPCSSIFRTDLCQTNCPLKSSINTGRRI